jgi:hypothetical protein
MESEPKAPENATETNERSALRRVKAPSRYVLPSERFAFQTHMDVMRRYLTASANGKEAVAASKVEGNGLATQSAQLNAAFLAEIGMLERVSPGVFKTTPAALSFITALSVSPDRARPILRDQLDGKWFSEAARNALQGHPVLTDKELQGELAIAAQTPLDKKAGALAVIIEYLLFAGILNRTPEGITLGNGVAGGPSVGPAGESPLLPAHAGGPSDPGAPQPPTGPSAGWETMQSNDFFVRVRATQEAVDDLRDVLKILEKKIKRAPKTQ